MIRFGVLTVSDRSSQGIRPDLSGPVLEELIAEQGWQTAVRDIVPDTIGQIRKKLLSWVELGEVDVILTTGGTGFAKRDVTPEATLAVVDRLTPGLVEAIRQESLKITPHAMLSRAVAGIRLRTLIVNFPGSPKACRENWTILLPVLPHAVQLLQDDPEAEVGH